MELFNVFIVTVISEMEWEYRHESTQLVTTDREQAFSVAGGLVDDSPANEFELKRVNVYGGVLEATLAPVIICEFNINRIKQQEKHFIECTEATGNELANHWLHLEQVACLQRSRLTQQFAQLSLQDGQLFN